MKTLKISEAEVGMLVKLTNPNIYYKIGRSNPAAGSRYECEGRITSKWDDTIYVSWTNGERNSYKSGELSLCEDEGICVDLWQQENFK